MLNFFVDATSTGFYATEIYDYSRFRQNYRYAVLYFPMDKLLKGRATFSYFYHKVLYVASGKF